MGNCGVSKPDPAEVAFHNAISRLQQAAKSGGSGNAAGCLAGIAAALGSSSKPSWLFVFDFDLTIAKYHLWSKHKDAPLANVPITNHTFVDLIAFQDFVMVVRKLGHHIAIASFGRKDVIDKAMAFALGEAHKVVISTPADHGHKDGSSGLDSKNTQLRALAERFSVVNPELIILFDDDGHNVKEAAKMGVGAVHTPGGLTKAVLAKAADHLWTKEYKS